MPIYVFVCTKCPNQFERIQKMDSQAPACDQCGAETERGIERVSRFIWGKGGAYNG